MSRAWVAVAAAVLLAAPGCGAGAGAHAEQASAVVAVPGAPAAPDFALRDAGGRTVRLSDFRGRPVLLTFLYTQCPDVCPLTVEKLRSALDQAPGGHVVVVSVDPAGDRPEAVRRFVRAHRMTGRLTYLVGSRRALTPVWRAYGVAVAGTPESREVSHSSLVYGIDARGRKALLFGHDFRAAQVAERLPGLAAA